MILMYDSTSAKDIPSDAAMVAGYVDGAFAWTREAWARFPSATYVRIAIFHTTNDGAVLDIERGCSETWCAPVWAKMRRAAGLAVPTFYCRPTKSWPDPYNQQAVINALVAGGVDPAGVAWWLADYTGKQHLPPGAIACQFANDAYTGHHYDLSIVSEAAPWLPQNQAAPAQIFEQSLHTGGNMRVDVKIPPNMIVNGRGWVEIDVPPGLGVSGEPVMNGADALLGQALPRIAWAPYQIGGGKWRVAFDGLPAGGCDIHIPLG
jgi:hypothetical protein